MSESAEQSQPHVLSPEEIAEHAEHDHVAAIFADRGHAADAVESLKALGIEGDHLGLALHGDAPVVFEHNEESNLFRDTATGAAVGAPIGAIAGIALAALAVPGLGLIGLGGMFLFGGASAVWGGMIGGYLGAASGLEGWNAHADFRYTALEPGEVLVVVCSHGRLGEVRDTMERHGGRLHDVEQTELDLTRDRNGANREQQ